MPEYEVPGTDCRQSIEGGFRLGSIGIHRCPGLRILIMRAIFYVCSVWHTFPAQIESEKEAEASKKQGKYAAP